MPGQVPQLLNKFGRQMHGNLLLGRLFRGEGLLWLADQACEQCGAELPDVPGGAVDAAGL